MGDVYGLVIGEVVGLTLGKIVWYLGVFAPGEVVGDGVGFFVGEVVGTLVGHVVGARAFEPDPFVGSNGMPMKTIVDWERQEVAR